MSGSVFSQKTFKLLGVAVGLLVLGYILLGQGPIYNHLSWTVAPLILFFVYCILLPWAILAKDKTEAKKEEQKK